MKTGKVFKAPGLFPALCTMIALLLMLFSCGKSEPDAFSFDYKRDDPAKFITVPEITSVTSGEIDSFAASIAAGSVLYDTDGGDKLILPGDRMFFKYTAVSGEKTAEGDTSLVVGEKTFMPGFDDAISYLTLTMGKTRDVAFSLTDGYGVFENGDRVILSVTPTLMVPRHVYEAVTFYAVQEQGALLQQKSSRTAAMFGDTVDLSYIIYLGCVAVEHNSCRLVVGSLTFPDLFEKAIIGLNEGERGEATYTAPDDSPADYAGREVTASVTLDRIVYRTFDDDMAAALGYSSAAEYSDEYDEKYLMANALWNALTARSAIKSYHAGMVEFYREWYVSSFEELYDYYAGVYGQMFTASYPTFDDFIVKFAGFGSMDEFDAEAENDAKRNAFSDLMTFTLALRHGIELSDDEYAVGAAKIAADYNYNGIDELIAGGYSEYQIRAGLLNEKVMTEIYALYEEQNK